MKKIGFNQQECDELRKLIEELISDKNRKHVDIERLKADIDYWSSSAVKTQKFM
jgi:hypothetical protein